MTKLSLLVVAACASDPSSSLVFQGTTVALPSGTEVVECWDFPIESSFAVTGVHVELPPVGTHHWSLTVGTGTAMSGIYDCARVPPGGGGGPQGGGGGVGGITLGIGGPGADAVTFPTGAALVVAAHSVLTLQLHLLNAGDAAIETAVPRIELAGTPDATGFQQVGMLVAASNMIDLEPRTFDVHVHAGCAASQSLDHVFAGYLHAHTRARALSVDVGGARALEANPWNFEAQQIYSLSTSVAAGTQVDLDCTYDNPGDTTIVGGQLSTDEMCVGLLYFYPASEATVACFGG